MALIDTRTARVLATASLFAMAVGFLYIAHRTLMAFLFAIFFAYLVDPAVSRVQRWTHSRGAAIAIIYALIVLLLATFFFFIGPSIARQAQRLSDVTPALIERISSGQIAEQIGAQHGWSLRSRQQLAAFLSDHRNDMIDIAQRVGLRVAEVAKQAWLLIVVPILAVFFLKDGQGFGAVLLSFVHTRAQRELVEGVLGDLNLMLAQFIRAQLTLAALSFIAYIAFLGLMRVPYALVLSSAGGLMEFIPLVGPLATALVMMSVALLSSYPHWALASYFSCSVADDSGLRRLSASDGEKHGIASAGRHLRSVGGRRNRRRTGVYLSIPVMASLRIVWRRWRMYAEKKRFGPLNEYSFGSEISPRT